MTESPRPNVRNRSSRSTETVLYFLQGILAAAFCEFATLHESHVNRALDKCLSQTTADSRKNMQCPAVTSCKTAIAEFERFCIPKHRIAISRSYLECKFQKYKDSMERFREKLLHFESFAQGL